jgi:hypothetical protein
LQINKITLPKMSIPASFEWPTSWENTTDTYPEWIARYNNTNTSLDFLSWCYTPKTFKTWGDYWDCYQAVAADKSTASILEILLAFGSAFVNTLVIICVAVSTNKKTCFDQILVGYCFVNGITGT